MCIPVETGVSCVETGGYRAGDNLESPSRKHSSAATLGTMPPLFWCFQRLKGKTQVSTSPEKSKNRLSPWQVAGLQEKQGKQSYI